MKGCHADASFCKNVMTKRASDVYTKFSPGIYDEFIYNHYGDATAGGDLFPRGYHKPSSQHFLC